MRLRIQKVKQGSEIGVAEVCTDAHMPRDCTRDARAEVFRRGVAAGAILLEDTLAAIWCCRVAGAGQL